MDDTKCRLKRKMKASLSVFVVLVELRGHTPLTQVRRNNGFESWRGENMRNGTELAVNVLVYIRTIVKDSESLRNNMKQLQLSNSRYVRVHD